MERKALGELFSFDIMPYARQQLYHSGDRIFFQGQQTAHLLYLVEGRVKCYVSHENGSVSLSDFASAPCFLGEMELLGVQQTTIAVTALTDCTCWVIDLTACRERILQDAKFLHSLCIYSNEKIVRITTVAAQNQIYPLKNRLATLILKTQRQGFYRERHTEAAAYLGVSYRHLLYVLADFVKSGILEKTPRGYHIVSPAELEAWAIQDASIE